MFRSSQEKVVLWKGKKSGAAELDASLVPLKSHQALSFCWFLRTFSGNPPPLLSSPSPRTYKHAHNQFLPKVQQWQERKSKYSQLQEHFVLVKMGIATCLRGVRQTTVAGLFIRINTLILQTWNSLFTKWTLEHWERGLLYPLSLLKHNHSRILNFNKTWW